MKNATIGLGIGVAMACMSTTPADAWGKEGHLIVCEIAFQELKPAAKAEVIRLIGKDAGYSTFFESCFWADVPKKRTKEHWVNLRRSAKTLRSSEPCPVNDPCLMKAIEGDLRTLKNPASTDSEKLRALKYLGHWIGDAHQPLHVSYKGDKGGNQISTSGSCSGNMHGAWDTCLPRRILGLTGGSSTSQIQSAGKDLWDEVKTDNRKAGWIQNDPLDWANESYSIATAARVKYCTWRRGKCQRSGSVRVDQRYINRHDDTIKDRLKQGGVRLAAALNEALAP